MSRLRHGGHLRALAARAGCAPSDIIDFSASINPLGPPDWLRSVVAAALSEVVHYPDPDCDALRTAAARRYGVAEAEVVPLNGSTELLHALPRLLPHLTRTVAFVPCYADYLAPGRAAGTSIALLPLRIEKGFLPDLDQLDDLLAGPGGPAVVFLGQPNNPTGRSLPAQELRRLASRHPDCLFVADEAFADFIPDLDRLTADRPANVVTLLSLTKFYAIPGLRIGLALAEPSLAGRLRDALPAWSVNTVAQAVGAKALADAPYAARTVAAVPDWRHALAAGLAECPGVRVFPGEANFLLAQLTAIAPGVPAARSAHSAQSGSPVLDASALADRLLLDHRIAIRSCANFEGLSPFFFRVAVRTPEENGRLLDALSVVLDRSPAPRISARPRRTPALMLQGTSSDAGKSLLAAGLCRVLHQDGLRVAPFKAQNMSLNSCVTLRGEEMGRAQVVQAQACRLDPDARMNPVLLKPCSDTGSQVIVMGRPVGNMSVRDYFAYKPQAFARAVAAYDDLASGQDVMVLEGAGSPAEVNLKAHDIVNMRMAAHAGAKVLIVGDIDRGGVFASLAGTMDCLDESERGLVAGFIINKFRGDPSLLGDGLDWLRLHTGRDTLGIVPLIPDLGLPDEDSVSFKAMGKATGKAAGRLATGPGSDPRPDGLDIVCIDLPHISNFTDLDPLLAEPDVQIRIVRTPEALGHPDGVILPGSKATISDLLWLRATGLADALLALAGFGNAPEIIGICGGLQMLGRTIEDPLGLESADGSIPGLGLLPLATRMDRDKTLRRTRCRCLDPSLAQADDALHGYEIHHGLTTPLAGTSIAVLMVSDTGDPVGYATAPSGPVWGGYLHGLFENDAFRRQFLNRLRTRRGLPPLPPQVRYDIEPALDRLAAVVRSSLDMNAIHRLLGL